MQYKKAYTEAYEVIQNLYRQDLEKIPYNVLEKIKKEKDITYEWKYDISKDINDQNLCKEAKEMLSYIFLNYIVEDDVKNNIMKNINSEKEYIYFTPPQKILSYDELFKNNNLPVKIEPNKNKNDSLLKKIIKIIYKFLNSK